MTVSWCWWRFFLALGIGQLFYGPVSDSTGRKPAVAFGLALYLCGTLLALLATRFEILLAGRFLQGAGAPGRASSPWR